MIVMSDEESAKQQQALKDLKLFERNMEYDGVRGSFQIKRIEIDHKIDVIIALEALGVKEEQIKQEGSGFERAIIIDDAEVAASLAKTLKEAGFNYSGAKNVPATQRSAG